jgi:hypothetical protein
MDVEATGIRGAVRWLEHHFELPYLPKGCHLKDPHAKPPYMAGYEQPVELLVKSGIWANLRPPTQRILPVLLAFAERGPEPGTLEVKISYRAIQKYSGVRSFGTIAGTLEQLLDLGWLAKVPPAQDGTTVLRDVNIYILTPHSDAVVELANATAATTRATVEQERQLRKQQRAARRDFLQKSRAGPSSPCAVLQSTSLYSDCSVGRNHATRDVAGICTRNAIRLSRPSPASRSAGRHCAPQRTAKKGIRLAVTPR